MSEHTRDGRRAREPSEGQSALPWIVMAVMLVASGLMLWGVIRLSSPARRMPAAEEAGGLGGSGGPAGAPTPRVVEAGPAAPSASAAISANGASTPRTLPPAPLSPPPASAPSAPRDPPPSPSAGGMLLGALRALPDQWRQDRAGALGAWLPLAGRMGTEWCELAFSGELSPANTAAAEFIRTVALESPRDLGAALGPMVQMLRVFAASAAPPDAVMVRPLAWSFGMLGRFASRHELGAGETRREVIAIIERIVSVPSRSDDPFGEHALAILGVMAERALPGIDRSGLAEERRERWARWLRAIEALGARSDAARAAADARLLDTAQALLTRGADPSMDAESRDVLRLVLGGLGNNAAPAARARMLEWLGSKELRTPPLAEAIAAMTEQGLIDAPPAPVETGGGILPLSPAAGPVERAAYARRCAAAWGYPAERPTDLVAEQWGEDAEAHAARAAPDDAGAALADAARSALLNAAAGALWRNDESAARQSLRAAASRPDEILAAAGSAERNDAVLASLTGPARAPDGQWAERYLAGMIDHKAKLDIINELNRSTRPLGPVDAGVVAHAAVLGPTPEIRAAAQRAARTQNAGLVMLHALLLASVQLPRQEGISELIRDLTGRDLPKPEDPDWPGAARAALVDRLAHDVARSRGGALDRFEALFAECIEMQLESAPGNTAPAAGAASPAIDALPDPQSRPPDAAAAAPVFTDPAAAAEQLRREWEARAAALVPGAFAFQPLESIRRAGASRRALAEGPMQRYSAEGASAAETMAYVVAGERPSRAPRVAEIVRSLRGERLAAASVQRQIAANERAMLRLWIVRLGREDAGGGP